MSTLRRAARTLRATLEPRSTGPGHAVARATALTVMVELEGRAELVSMRMQDGALSVLCTCGAAGCAHAQEALALFEDEPRPDAVDERITHVFEPAMRMSEPSPLPAIKVTPEVRNRLSDVLSDVVLAVTRAGVSEGISAGVSEALERLAEHAPPASATGLRVWVGTLRGALEARDTAATARALGAATAMIDALRKVDPGPHADQRAVAWLGVAPSSPAASDRVSERTYLELAREHRPGLARAGVEQRYLIDLDTGELFREDRAANETASLGPCPRAVSIGLAHIEPGVPPRRIRLLQYTTTPLVEASAWQRVTSFALPSFEPLLSRQKEHMKLSAGMTDMLALVKPARVHASEGAQLVDDGGRALLLSGAEGTASRLESFLTSTEPQWVLGRMLVHADMLALVPLAACGLRHGKPAHLHL
jgi:hypothetical protein